ncbi:MAG TPA: amino acid adenylation domain-containing protein [Stellaceae bacterium]|jgi:iturin family lipopeptide synthetase B
MAITRENVRNIYPLAPMQEGMLAHALAEPDSAAYSQQLAIRVTGDLDIALFEACWNELVARHDILRTIFAAVDGDRPLQVVLKRCELAFAYHGLRTEDGEAAAERLRAQERARPFDLAKGPLLRIMVLRIAERLHEVIFGNHHIILDGWSLGILQSEFLTIYEARRRGAEHRLAPAPGYNRFIKYLGEIELERGREFWRDALAGYDQTAGLPPLSKQTLPPAQYATSEFVLEPTLMAGIERSAAQLGATTGTAVQAIFAVVLARYSGVEDVVFGGVVSGRPPDLPEVERIVGLFINTIPVRARPSRGKTIAALIAEMQAAALAAEPYHAFPLDRILADHPLKQGLISALIAYENYPIDAQIERLGGPGGLGFAMREAYERTHYDFVLQCLPAAGGLTVRVTYDPVRYGREQVAAIEGHLTAIARRLVENPGDRIGNIDLVTAAERHGLVVPARCDFTISETIVDRFAATVRASPGAVAVSIPATEEWAADSLTYCALDELANALAHRLHRMGVGPETRVGLLAERELDLMVGVFGILKTGGAYVPLDPAYPTERLAYMVADARIGVVVATTGIAERIDLGATIVPIVSIDDEAREDDEPLAIQLKPENTAYVIYTSGSTGRPKGVVVTHANVLRLFAASASRFSFGADDVWTLFHSFAFDFSVWEMFGALFYGGRLVVVPHWTSRAPAAFLRLLAAEGVTVLNQTPSAFSLLLQAEEDIGGIALPRLRYVIFGGEALDPARLDPWFARHGTGTRLINMYGITETTVHVTWREIGAGDVTLGSMIGAPLDDLSLHVLDQELRPVPLGVAGELFVCGAGLARGYLGRPELTAERFVPDPFAGKSGARLYRSGDLARRLPRGEIEYLGRIDQQVKIRGFRIELNEIAAELRRHEDVAEAAVLALPGADGRLRLIAYVAGERPPDDKSLRRFLGERLPEHMLPAAFVALHTLPLTENGKLDRRALPAPETAPATIPYQAPKSPTETTLAETWCEVLGRAHVGRDESYFALGGDSIKAIQISSRLLKRGLKLNIRDLFRHPTIAALAPLVQPARSPATAPSEEAGAIPLTPIQARFFEAHGAIPRFNHALLLGAPARLDTAALGNALRALQRHHDALRYRFIRRDGAWMQELGAAPIDLAIADLRGDEQWSQTVTARAEAAQASFSLATGPLLRAILFRTEAGDRLLLVIHHLIIDGVSWRILLEDMAEAYQALLRGATPRLPPADASFAQWSRALAAFAASETAARDLPYWTALADADTAPPQPGRFGDARTVTVELDADETADLLRDANRAYNTTPEDLLLTALGRALQAWHGRDRTLIAREGHGREAFLDINVNRTFGWFTALYPFMLAVPSDRDLGIQIKTVKEASRHVPLHGIGYGLLRYLRPDDATTAPLHRIHPAMSFNYLGDFDAGLTAGGLTAIDHPIGAPVDPGAQRPFALDLALLVRSGHLQISATYDPHHVESTSIDALLQAFCAEIRAVTRFCRERPVTEKTPADFTAADISLDTFDAIGALVGADNLEDLYPLSPMQRAMLIHAVQQPDSRAYFEQFSYRLEGEFDATAFRAAWDELFRRHSILRTGFLHQFGAPFQAVLARLEPEIATLDLTGRDRAAQERAVAEYRLADRRRGFDVSDAPLMRFQILRLAETRHEIVWSMHHLLLDGWSTALLNSDFQSLYDAFRSRRDPALPPAIPYARYIEWLLERDTRASLAYWKDYLDGAPQPTTLPRDRMASAGYTLATFRTSLDRDTASQLEALASSAEVTLSTIFRAGWALSLAQQLDLDDVVFGTVVSGRPASLSDAEQMIGLFINAVPVRARLERQSTVLDLLHRLRDDAVASEPHHYCALAEVQAQAPQLQIDHLLVFENYPVAATLGRANGALAVERVERHEQTNYDFTLVITPGDRVAFEALYNAQAFSEAAISGLLAHFTSAVSRLCGPASRRLGELEVIGSAERLRLLRAFGSRPGRTVAAISLWDGFRRQAARREEAVALRFAGGAVSYGALAGRAVGVARALGALGIRTDDAVGILADRSVELIAGLVGITAAGGGYVGLETGSPAARLQALARSCGMRAVVAQARHREIAATLGLPVVILEEMAAADWRDLAAPGGGESLAYVSFTSGSTGAPKGVAVSQRSVLGLVLGSDFARLDEHERVLHYAPVAFDASTFEIWGALLNGGCLVVMPPGVASLEVLGETIRREEVTSLWLTAGLFEVMAAERLTDLRGVRQLLAGGDVLPVAAVRRVLGALPDCRLINGYGPTETTTFACCHAIVAADIAAGGAVPVGRPIAGARVYVLDRRLRPCAVGMVGEIYIGGSGVARGYVGDPSATAASFVPNPYSETGERLYRSGDLARWRADGVVEFLGRADDQLKLRGYRLSLSEIETVLGEQAGVERCVAVVRGEGAAKRLVAYAVAPGASAEALRARLAARLPAAAVPGQIVLLEALPLNANGKLDRSALPAPPQAAAAPPQSEAERRIAAIWQEVLGLDTVARDDNFFELGGHSLAAIQITARIGSGFNIALPLSAIFEAQTVGGLAREVAKAEAAGRTAGPITRQTRSPRRGTAAEQSP